MYHHSVFIAILSLLIFLASFPNPAMAGDLYKWTDDKGQVHYSSVPPITNPGKAKAVDPNSLPRLNTLPSNPSAGSAEDGSGQTSNHASTSKPVATPPVADNRPPAEPASPPALIPASLLPPSNPPTTAKSQQPAQSDIVEVVAQGMGVDSNAALLNAYSNAVQQALGSYVDAEILVQNDQIVHDKILTYSKGFIEKVDIVSQNQANGLFQVNIRAKVKRQQLLEQAKANNISLKAVDGTSLHAKVMSQIKQEQDANALLEKALLPFAGTDLMRAEVIGEPTVVKQEQGDITLSYPIYLFVDENEYKKTTSDLIAILNTMSSDIKELTMQNKNVESDKFNEDINLADFSGNKKSSCIKLLTWKDKQLTHSKWLSYSFPSNLNLEQLAQNLNRSEIMSSATASNYALAIELSLLGKGEEIIAMGSTLPDFFYLAKYHLFTKDLSTIKYQNNCYVIRPYFSNESYLGISYQKIPIVVTIKVAQQDLPNVKTAKLEVKREH